MFMETTPVEKKWLLLHWRMSWNWMELIVVTERGVA
jgi:hypothetical protein